MPLPAFSMQLRALSAAAASVAAAMGLAACSSAGAQVESSGTGPPPGGFAAVDEPPMPTADEDPDEPSTWVIANGAVGGIRLGDDFEAAVDDAEGQWSADGTCAAAWRDGAGYEIEFSTSGDGIDAIIVSGALGAPTQAPSTAEGLGLGSTRDEVRAVFPAAQETAVSGSGSVLRADGADTTGADLSFEVSEAGRIVRITLASDDASLGGDC